MTEPPQRRAAHEQEVTRVLDAVEEIMLREGYAAVTPHNVAAHAGIEAAVLGRRFPTVDDLFVATMRRRSTRTVERLAGALASSRPLRAWWDLLPDQREAALRIEFLAAGNHRPALRAETGEITREARRMQTAALDTLMIDYGLDPEEFPPALLAATMQGLALVLAADEAAPAARTSTEQARAAVGRLLDRLERQRAHLRPR